MDDKRKNGLNGDSEESSVFRIREEQVSFETADQPEIEEKNPPLIDLDKISQKAAAKAKNTSGIVILPGEEQAKSEEPAVPAPIPVQQEKAEFAEEPHIEETELPETESLDHTDELDFHEEASDAEVDEILEEVERYEEQEKLAEANQTENTVEEPVLDGQKTEVFEAPVMEEPLQETGVIDVSEQPRKVVEPVREVRPQREVPQQPKKKKKRRKKASALGIFFRIILALILVSVLAFGAMAVVYAASDMMGLTQSEDTAELTIAPNTSVTDIAQMLKENKIIKYPEVFRLYIKYKLDNNVSFNYGTYELHLGMSYEDVINELEKVSGNSDDIIRITFPEHYTVSNMADVLQDKGICTREEFLTAVNEYDIANPTAGATDEARERITKLLSTIENPDQRMYKLEGYLFPDTYSISATASPTDIINTMLANFESKFTVSMKNAADSHNLTIDQAITLASIVQKEAPDKANMLRIADVYLNRLGNSSTFPKLQSDPTRKYGEEVILANGGSQEMATSYNTYESDGLPPGPIGCPGVDALKAVAYPTTSNPKNYFFCSNVQTGECFYATTNEEHEANLVKAGLK